ncbi:MAG TPA: hypothetical protein VF006_12865 [Longimicrobium sp.]
MAPHLVDVSRAFAGVSHERIAQDVRVTLAPHTYLPDGELTQGWLPNILDAFRSLGRRLSSATRPVRSFASIGVGPGLEVIAAAELLGVDRFVLTDLHADVTKTAKENVLRNVRGLTSGDIEAFVSDLCAGLIERQIAVDVLYENLPNLPALPEEVSEGALSASFFDREKARSIPRVYAEHRLTLHYHFLSQARRCVTTGGRVVCCIGGRIPMRLVRSMFEEHGFTADVLHFAMVRQFESEKVLDGYVQAEEETGITFRFFPFEEAAATLARIREEQPRLEDIESDAQWNALALTARQAHDLEAGGTAIGHLGVVWQGVPSPADTV